MAPVDEEGHTGSTEGACGEPIVPVEEISRNDSLYSRQKALEHQDKSAKRKFTNGLSTLEK